MQFTYFNVNFVTAIEECKRQYHRLANRYHPDRTGGSDEAMKRINAEWDYLKAHNYNIHEARDGSTYTKEDQWRPDDVTERFAELIDVLMGLEGVGIEVCGSFVWLSGNTYAYRDQIRGLGFKWSRRKRRWYAAPSGWRPSHTSWSMERIRAVHGSQVVSEGFVPEQKLLVGA